jgi:hypothetical protein
MVRKIHRFLCITVQRFERILGAPPISAIPQPSQNSYDNSFDPVAALMAPPQRSSTNSLTTSSRGISGPATNGGPPLGGPPMLPHSHSFSQFGRAQIDSNNLSGFTMFNPKSKQSTDNASDFSFKGEFQQPSVAVWQPQASSNVEGESSADFFNNNNDNNSTS